MKLTLRALVVLVMFWLTGCDAPQKEAVRSPTVDAKTSPNPKEVLRYLLRNGDVPLTVDSSCSGVGTTADDRTIGDYLSGFLAEHVKLEGMNWLEVSTKAVTTADGKQAWECQLIVRRKDAEDVMGWGVSFVVTAADRMVVRESFRCLGGG